MQTVNVLNVTKPSCSRNANINLLVRFTLCQFWFEILHFFDFFFSDVKISELQPKNT